MAPNIAKIGFLRGGVTAIPLHPPVGAHDGVGDCWGKGCWGRVLGGCCGGRGGLGCGARGRESGCWVWGKGVLDWGGGGVGVCVGGGGSTH